MDYGKAFNRAKLSGRLSPAEIIALRDTVEELRAELADLVGLLPRLEEKLREVEMQLIAPATGLLQAAAAAAVWRRELLDVTGSTPRSFTALIEFERFCSAAADRGAPVPIEEGVLLINVAELRLSETIDLLGRIDALLRALLERPGDAWTAEETLREMRLFYHLLLAD